MTFFPPLPGWLRHPWRRRAAKARLRALTTPRPYTVPSAHEADIEARALAILTERAVVGVRRPDGRWDLLTIEEDP